jgi:hypothetical protein
VSISSREAILKVMDSDGFNRDGLRQFHHGFTFPIAVVIAAANFDPFHQGNLAMQRSRALIYLNSSHS